MLTFRLGWLLLAASLGWTRYGKVQFHIATAMLRDPLSLYARYESIAAIPQSLRLLVQYRVIAIRSSLTEGH